MMVALAPPTTDETPLLGHSVADFVQGPPPKFGVADLQPAFDALGWHVTTEVPPSEDCVGTPLVAAIARVVQNHAPRFAAVTTLLAEAPGGTAGLYAWADGLCTVACAAASGLASTPGQDVALRFLDAQVFLAYVAAGCREVAAAKAAVPDFPAPRLLLPWRLRFFSYDADAVVSSGSRGFEPTKHLLLWGDMVVRLAGAWGEDAEQWCAAGSVDHPCEFEKVIVWHDVLQLREARAAILSAVRAIIPVADFLIREVAASHSCGPLFKDLLHMTKRINSVSLGLAAPRWVAAPYRQFTCKHHDRDGPCVVDGPDTAGRPKRQRLDATDLVLLDDPAVGAVLEALLPVVSKRFFGDPERGVYASLAPVLAAYLARGTFRTRAILDAVVDFTWWHPSLFQSVVMQTIVKPHGMGYTRPEVEFWWCVSARQQQQQQQPFEALATWREIVFNSLLEYVYAVAAKVARTCQFFNVCHKMTADGVFINARGHCLKEVQAVWEALQQDASLFVSVTGLAQDLQLRFCAIVASVPYTSALMHWCGPPHTFVRFCEGHLRWLSASLRAVWLGVVFRAGVKRTKAAPSASARGRHGTRSTAKRAKVCGPQV